MIRQQFSDGWAFRAKVNEFAELSRSVPAEPVTLPHDAVIGTQRDAGMDGGAATGFFPGGVWEYTKKFFVPQEWAAKRIRIEFEGVYRSALVYLNDDLAGRWASGYTGFSVKADDFIRYGEENVLRVEARSHRDSRWYSGGGIHRPVHLVVADPVHVALDGIAVTTSDIGHDRAVVHVATTIENEARRLSTVTVETTLFDAEDNVVAVDRAPVSALPGEDAVLRQRMTVLHPALWSVDSPSLYRASVTVRAGEDVIDEADTTFGIRTLELDAVRGFRINGEVVKLRGACVHHDNGVLGAAAIARAEERRVELLKQAGFNAIRSSHNPMSRAMLDACDRLGVLVMDEAFDMWTQNKSDFDYALDFADWWERDIEAMVRKDRNHPSVFAYSIGNEIPEAGRPHGAIWARRLAERVRSLDSTRYVTSGVNALLTVMDELKAQAAARQAEGTGINTFMSDAGEMMNQIGTSDLVTERTAEVFATLDVAGLNYLDGRYELDQELFPNRVIVGSETFPTRIDHLWRLVMKYPHVIGDFTWAGWDYLGEVGVGRPQYRDEPGSFMADYPWLTAWVGDIDITGVRRPASYYREIVFGLRSAPYLAVRRPESRGREVVSSPWAWSDSIASWTWPGQEGKPLEVEVYSDADEVELLVNGASLGRETVHRYRAEFEVPYAEGVVTAIAYRGGAETGRAELRTAIGEVALTATADRSIITAGVDDLTFVEITLVDRDGVVHTAADRRIEVTIDGPAVLQGLGSGNPQNTEPFTAAAHSTFCGRVLAVIRPTGPGDIRVSVAADPGLTAEVLVTAEKTA
ncbi:glycoside hydrolase family 2 TIM barrel-domain containing protein [Lentzea sp. DG1S-22]|uniref:glycoside hydrolase family 2 TIM barrel-domain containing protein n=1 Tax=Lentzea sp. DG1S-22 TaxID=3108822 RepID=UPI002E77F5EE|nr:glycoside hydrolase family 2 TIM barrel-domain containing protein [Lentzea sp. DG1S-22]WVH82710.1 glycoside hydrolase family 2 TIM barrel-domain containing protein [Lentzea sp. DG1S-22]